MTNLPKGRLHDVVRSLLRFAPLLVFTLSCSSADAVPSTADVGPPLGGGNENDSSSDKSDAAGDGAQRRPSAIADDGPNHCNGATLAEGALCPTKMLSSLVVIGPTFSVMGSDIVYGSGSDLWNVFGLAGPGQEPPTIRPTAGSLSVTSSVVPPSTGQGWTAVGASLDGTSCIDESTYARGLVFTLTGNLGDCLLFLEAIESQDESSIADPCRGACPPAGRCTAPTVQITQTGRQTIPNMSFSEGGEGFGPNTSQLIGYRWRFLTPPNATTGCTANIVLADVQTIGL